MADSLSKLIEFITKRNSKAGKEPVEFGHIKIVPPEKRPVLNKSRLEKFKLGFGRLRGPKFSAPSSKAFGTKRPNTSQEFGNTVNESKNQFSVNANKLFSPKVNKSEFAKKENGLSLLKSFLSKVKGGY